MNSIISREFDSLQLRCWVWIVIIILYYSSLHLNMDPLFVTRQPAPPPTPSNIWQNVAISNSSGQQLQHPDIEYHFANASHSFSSPPSTPMTPIPHHLQHGGFPITHLDPQHHGSLVLYNIPTDIPPHPPALSHPNWPPEYRLYSLCQELQQYPTADLLNEEASTAWWDRFIIEYFHNLATLVIEIDFGEGMKRYTVSREYISWYFKSILHENGVSRYNMLLGDSTVHSFQQQIQRILCNNAVQELDYVTPHQTKVCCQGQLLVDFTIEDKPRVLHWVFHVINHVELIPRFCLHAAGVDSCLSNNITRKGLPAATQALLLQLNQPSNNTGPNVGPVIRESCPQLTSYPQEPQPSGAWEPTPRIDVPASTLQSTDGSSVLSHPPLPPVHHINNSPPPLSNPLQLSIRVPPTSNVSPDMSPVLNVSVNSNGSTCSISSCTNSNQPPSVPPQSQSQIHIQSQTQPQTQSQPHTQSHPHSLKLLNSSSKRSIISPSVKPHKFLVAMEPAYFNEDMVHSDERLITRIENCNTKTTPIPSTTPTSTSTNDHNDSIPSLSWLDALGSSVPTWNIQPRLLPTEQR